MSCSFSAPIVGTASQFSPSGEYVASLSASRLTVRNSHTLEVTNIFQAVDKIEKAEFSPDSEYILCALYARNAIQVFSLRDKTWKCRINEGVTGMVHCFWAPDSRKIAVESDFGIQLSFWSLTDSTSTIISLPKAAYPGMVSQMAAYSDDSQFLAVVHRIDLQDYIGVYATSPLGELTKFKARSNDICAVHWVPTGAHIIALDSPLHYRFGVYLPSGEILSNYEAYDNALGLRTMAVFRMPAAIQERMARSRQGFPGEEEEGSVAAAASATTTSSVVNSSSCSPPLNINIAPSMVALGSFDGKLRLMSMYSWNLAFVFPLVHPRDMEAGIDTSGLVTTVEVSTAYAHEQDDGESHREGGVMESTIFSTLEKRNNKSSSNVSDGFTNAAAAIGGKDGKRTTAMSYRASSAAAHRESLNADTSIHGLPTHSAVSGGATCYVERMLKVLPKSVSSDTSGSARGGGAGSGGSSSTSAGSLGRDSGLPNLGVSWCGFSIGDGGHYLAARDDSYPRCLWVWHPMQTRLVALIVQLENITCARWRPFVDTGSVRRDVSSTVTSDPGGAADTSTSATELPSASSSQPDEEPQSVQSGAVLVFCTGSNRLYFWNPTHGSSWADLPINASTTGTNGGIQQLNVTSAHWSADGRRLLCRSKEAFCVCEIDYNDLDMQGQDGQIGSKSMKAREVDKPNEDA